MVCCAPHLAAGYCPADLYLDSLAAPSSRASTARVLTRLGRLLDPAPGQACPWHQLTYGALVTLWAEVAGKGYAVKTLRAARCALHGVIRQQTGLGLIDLGEERRLLLAVPIVRGTTEVAGRALTTDEIGRLLAAVAAPEPQQAIRDRALIALLYATGLRGAELCGLRWPVDLTADLHELRVHGKGHRDRRAYVMDATARAALADWLVVRGEEAGPLFCRVTTGGYARLAFPLLPGGLRRIVGAAGRRAGLGRVTSHDLRRTFATALADKIPLDVLSRLLGHASVTTTQLYVRRDEATLQRAAALLPPITGGDDGDTHGPDRRRAHGKGAHRDDPGTRRGCSAHAHCRRSA